MSTVYIPTEPPKKITYIGPDGEAYWIGTKKGLKDMHPFALIIKTENNIL